MLASIPSPSSSGFNLALFEVHVYGLMYVIALGLAILITVRRWEALGGSRDLVYDVALMGISRGVNRRKTVLRSDQLELGSTPLVGTVRGLGRRDGDLGRDRSRRRGRNLATAPSLSVRPGPFTGRRFPGILVGQAVGRIGNYFNQELFGGPSSLPWALQISAGHRPPGYENFATFQPTFLYELIWNLSLAAFLVWLGHHRRIKPPGLFALYVAGYSAFRIFEESIRVEPGYYIFGLRLNFYVACLLTIVGQLFVRIQRRAQAPRKRRHRARGSTLLVVGWATAALVGCGQSSSAGSTLAKPNATHKDNFGESEGAPASAPHESPSQTLEQGMTRVVINRPQ